MKNIAGYLCCWRWLLPALAILLAPAVMGQGTIVYVHAPLSNPNDDPNHLPWDSQGTQVGPDFPVVATNTKPLKVTICWTDPAGTPPAASVDPTNLMLVNDLDLRIICSSTTNSPWVLDPVTRTNAATTGDNIRDNVEQIVITNPTSGTYTVRVTHKGTLVDANGASASQRVSVLDSGNLAQPKPPLILTSPVVVSSNLVATTWPSTVGQRYQLQYKNDLNATNWTNLGGEVSATKTNVAVTTAFTNAIRFYRVAEVQ